MNPKKKSVKSPKQSKKRHDSKHRPRTSKIQPKESIHRSLDKSNKSSSIPDDNSDNGVEEEEFKKNPGSHRVLTLSASSLKSGTFDLHQFEGLPDQEEGSQVAHEIEIDHVPPSQFKNSRTDLEFVNEKFQPPPITSTMNLSPRPSHGILKKHHYHQNQYDHHHHYHHGQNHHNQHHHNHNQQQNIYSSTPSIFPDNAYRFHAPVNYPPGEEDNLRVVNYHTQVPSSTHVSPSKSLRVEETFSPPPKLTMNVNGLKSSGIHEDFFPPYVQNKSTQHPNNVQYRNLTEGNHIPISKNGQRSFRHPYIKHGDMMLHHISGGNNKILESYKDENHRDFEEDEEEEEYEDNPSRGNKRNLKKNSEKKRNETSQLFVDLTFQEICESIFLGDAPLIRDFLSCKEEKWYWWPFHMIECFFRSISAISLTSNVLCGLILYVTMMLVNPLPTALGTIGIFSGILTSLCLQIPLESLRTGGWTFNSFLLGIVIGELSSGIDWMERWDIFFIAMAAGSIVIFVCGGVNAVFENHLRLPMLNFPFNFLALLYIKSGIALLYKSSMAESVSSSSNVFQGVNGVDLKEGSNNETGQINYSNTPLTPLLDLAMNEDSNGLDKSVIQWIKVIEGVILTPSHFYGTKTVLSSSMVYLNYFIFSRVFFCQAVLGSVIGSLVGLALDDSIEKYSLVYNGAFAYNSLLTSVTIGGLFFVFNFKSWILSIISSILAALLYATMSKTNVTLGFPFMLISWIFLSASYSRHDMNENGKPHSDPARVSVHSSSTSMWNWKQWMTLYRVSNISTPENHMKEYLKLISRDKHTTKKKEGPKSSSTPAPLQLQL